MLLLCIIIYMSYCYCYNYMAYIIIVYVYRAKRVHNIFSLLLLCYLYYILICTIESRTDVLNSAIIILEHAT